MNRPDAGRPGRWLFAGSCLLATGLLATVLLAPVLDRSDDPAPEGMRRVVAVFSRDVVLRRICLASAVGLVVSACVFFLPGRRQTIQAQPPPPRPRSSHVAGA